MNINDKMKASMILGSYLDTLGFFNGKWEFNFNTDIYTIKNAILVQNEIITQYFALGGADIDLKALKLIASDDTIMMIATKDACLKGGKINDFMDEYIKIIPELDDVKRQSGYVTVTSLKKLQKTKNIKSIKYERIMGGNGAAMRTSFIGLKYYKENMIDDLIEKSIDASRLTHNYPMGFLGGLVTALFCSYGMRNIAPWKWGQLLIDLNNSGKIDKYMEKIGIKDKYDEDKYKFWDPWYKYVEVRLPKFYVKSKEFIFCSNRISDLINYVPGVTVKNNQADFSKFGSTGCGATLLAYDSFLCSLNLKRKVESFEKLTMDDINFSWQNLLFFSTLHFGDNDSTGIIAGSWYGALKGFDGFKKEKMNELEFKKELLTF